MTKTILVTGATGTQGGGLIEALLALPNATQFTILAVTRDVSSAKAKSLLAKSPSIKLVQGDLNNVSTLFDEAISKNGGRKIWGVFSVQTFVGRGASVESEEAQGKALVDESIKRQVSHFVYASVERGGDEKSWNNPTNVPHFISKHRIELHLRDAAARAKAPGIDWTILRPTTFYENISTGFFLKLFATWWLRVIGQKPLQLIAGSDIGWFGAQAFLKPDVWNGRAIGLVGDELTWDEFEAIFSRVTGRSLPLTYILLARVVLWAIKDINLMFRWFRDEGAKADLEALRKMNPKLQDVETWLASERSEHGKKVHKAQT